MVKLFSQLLSFCIYLNQFIMLHAVFVVYFDQRNKSKRLKFLKLIFRLFIESGLSQYILVSFGSLML